MVRALAAGAISTGFAFYNFSVGASALSVGFLSAFDTAAAYAAMSVFLWAVYMTGAILVLAPLDDHAPAARDAATVAFSVAVTAFGGIDLARQAGSSTGKIAILALVAALTPLLYAQLKQHFSRLTRELVDPLGFICAITLFSVSTSYSWVVNYSRYSFESASGTRWAGLTLLLLCAVPTVFRHDRSVWKWARAGGLASVAVVVFGLVSDSLPAEGPVVGSPTGPKRVIVITIDTLRADALSCYRQGDVETPNIDSLAHDGTLFRHTYSPASWTMPSMTSIFTGVTPLVHGVSLKMEDANLPTIADYFKGDGYETVGVFGNPVLTSRRGPTLGTRVQAHFDISHGFRSLRLFAMDRFGENVDGKFYALLRGFDLSRGGNTSGLADLTLQRLRASGDRPLLLWTHFLDPHWPYSPVEELIPKSPPPPPSIGTSFDAGPQARLGTRTLNHDERAWAWALYQAEVRYVDQAVGRVLDALREAGTYDDSIIVLTSDHGEEFWEHGHHGHGHSLHRETVTVPLIIKLPGERQGQVVETPVENRALLPTLLELASVPHEPNPSWAASLVPLLRRTGGYDSSAPIVNSGVELFEDEAAIRVGDLRYIRRLYSGDEWLYDLAEDPGETNSILIARPDDADRLRKAMDDTIEASLAARKSMGLSSDATDVFDEETLRRLKSLGYL